MHVPCPNKVIIFIIIILFLAARAFAGPDDVWLANAPAILCRHAMAIPYNS